jgi:competence protein ComEC
LALTAICLGWIAGVLLGSNANLAPVILSGWFISLLLLAFRRQKRAVLVSVLSLLAIAAGAFYFQTSRPLRKNSQISYFNDTGTVTVRGMVGLDPDVQDKTTRIKLSVDAIEQSGNWQAVSGMVMLYVPRYPQLSYGDILEVTGKLQTPVNFADFDYEAFLAKQSVFSVMDYPRVQLDSPGHGSWFLAGIYNLRHGLADVMARALPEPQASLAQGIILGLRGNISDEVNADFARSGTTHILAVSGMNLTILSGLLSLILARLIGKRFYLYVWLTLAVIWLYTLISGLSPSVLRAAIMGSLFLAAELLGRQKNAGPALCLAAAVMIGFNPVVLFDVSFQLSALSMAGIIFLYPLLRDSASGIVERVNKRAPLLNSPVGFISDSFSMTLAATLAVWPASAVYFGTVSLAAPFATLFAVPVLPFIMVLGSLMAAAGLLYLPVAIASGWAVWVFTSYLLLVVNVFSKIPGAVIAAGNISRILIVVYYASAVVIVWMLTRRQQVKFAAEMGPAAA